jgi:hypothetical protein
VSETTTSKPLFCSHGTKMSRHFTGSWPGQPP